MYEQVEIKYGVLMLGVSFLSPVQVNTIGSIDARCQPRVPVQGKDTVGSIDAKCQPCVPVQDKDTIGSVDADVSLMTQFKVKIQQAVLMLMSA
jgi:hypothetical protein